MNVEIKDTPVDQMGIEDIRAELLDLGVKLHHKTGLPKLMQTLKEVRGGTYTPEEKTNTPEAAAPKAPTPAPSAPNVPTAPKVVEPTDAAKAAAAAHSDPVEEKLTKEQRALRMRRIVVTCNDANMSDYEGLIFTVGSSAVKNGKMIKKYVPFDNEHGWHVPQMIIDNIDAAEVQKFRKITLQDGTKSMEPYIAKKFNVRYLPPLTRDEWEALAAAQRAKTGMQV